MDYLEATHAHLHKTSVKFTALAAPCPYPKNMCWTCGFRPGSRNDRLPQDVVAFQRFRDEVWEGIPPISGDRALGRRLTARGPVPSDDIQVAVPQSGGPWWQHGTWYEAGSCDRPRRYHGRAPFRTELLRLHPTTLSWFFSARSGPFGRSAVRGHGYADDDVVTGTLVTFDAQWWGR